MGFCVPQFGNENESALKKLILFICCFNTLRLYSQEDRVKVSGLSLPEKLWVISHPFAAKKAKRITLAVLKIYDQTKNEMLLSGGEDGGQLDAFRHCFWMAALSQQIKAKKVSKLGKAHEKGNYRDFKKKRLEEGRLPDAISGEMDLKNNEIGIEMGGNKPEIDLQELKALVIKAVNEGKLYIIAKDTADNFIDCSGNTFDIESYQGKWEIPKCLTKSNQLPQQ